MIENEDLRNLMKQGTKFRENPNPNFSKMVEQISEALESLISRWSDKERNVTPEQFRFWKKKVIDKVQDRIVKLKMKCRRTPHTGEILKKNEVKEALRQLHDKFVISVVDKAANNFAITCRKFYLVRLALELGVDTGRFGNNTYCRLDQTEEEVCLRIRTQMAEKFDIYVPDEYLKLPVLQWIPKFHKNPIGYRFIAGSREKVLTVLEVEVQKILNLLETHFRNYCEVIRSNSGFKHFFSINNSKQALEMMNNVSNPEVFDSFDFSNLYTNFEHDELISKFKFLLDLLFTNAAKKNNGDSIRTENRSEGKARWCILNEDNLRKYSGQKFWTKSVILDAIAFLIRNAHVKFGNLIFLQICGIPMGMIPAPGFAKLGLGVDEYKYCTKLVKDKRIDILRKLENMVRYIDDVGVANFLAFGDIAKEMYPRTLTLNKSNVSGISNCAFLDLNVSIENDKFRIKVYNKTDDYSFKVIVFPYLESNILTSVCYSVYFGEILRYLRISSRLEDFESRSRKLTDMLKERKYQLSKMARQFIKVFMRHKKDGRKFGNIVIQDSVQRVVYGTSSQAI